MKESNDKKWTIAEVLTNFGQRQSQIQQEKMIKQQLKDALMQNQANALGQFVPGMEQQMPPINPEDASLDEYYQQAKRGGIHLDPRKKGTFKAQATRMGMSIQEAAAHILRNKEEYSPGMVKKANFARNFAKEEGGTINNPGFNALPEYVQDKILSNMQYGGDFEIPDYADGGKTNPTINCGKCGWSWKMSDAGSDPTTCHKCGSKDAEVEMKRGGQMIKRADGSYSQRGLWDNIRANRGSGKEPTKEMLAQERNIRRKADGGSSDCPQDYKWNDEMQTCVPIVTDTYAKDYLSNWYQRRPEIVNDPNFETLDESQAHGNWLNKVLPMINERMETSNVPIQYTEMIQENPNASGAYREATKKSGPLIEIAERVRQNPFENAQTQLHEYTTESTSGTGEKLIIPVHQRIADENIKSYEDFLETSPMADAVKNDKDLEEELYNDYMYSSGQTPEGKGNVHSYVMNWRKMFNMDPTKVYTEDDVESMIAQAQQSGMLTKGSPNFSDDLYRLYRLSKDTKGLTNMFNLMANTSTPVRPERLNDEIQYAKYGGNFGYMPNFF